MAVIDGKWLSKEGLTYFWSKIKAIFTKQTETNVIANLGAKNLLEITESSRTVNGVTFTVNDDQTITVNGTASANADFTINYSLPLMAGRYILSGCPSGGSGASTTYNLQIQGVGYDTGDGYLFAATGSRLNLYIRVWSGYTANNLVFKPMIRRAEITDDTYVPYAPTNRELYETCETKVTMQQAYGDATAIPANSNLNNYITPGIYYVLISNVPTITNTPYTATGLRLVVEKNTPSSAAVFQTLYPTSRSHLEFYRRVYEGGSWSSWYRFTGETVVVSASTQSLNSTMTLNLDRNDLNESLDTNFDLTDSIPEEKEGDIE